MRALSIFIICISLVLPSTLYPATTTQATSSTIKPPEIAFGKLASLKVKEIQKIIGRKLTFKEKISFLVLKHTSKKEAQTKKGNTAMIFGIVGVGLFLIGLFVPFVILGAIAAAIVAIVLGSSAKRQDPSDQKARAAVLLGWITLGATALLLIIAAIVVLSGVWLL
jgi:hypothetical protein